MQSVHMHSRLATQGPLTCTAEKLSSGSAFDLDVLNLGHGKLGPLIAAF